MSSPSSIPASPSLSIDRVPPKSTITPMGTEIIGAPTTGRIRREFRISKNPLPVWLRDENALKVFRDTIPHAHNYVDLAKAVGVSKSSMCGAAMRAGGLVKLFEAAGVSNADTEAKRILDNSLTYRAVREQKARNVNAAARPRRESAREKRAKEKAEKIRTERIDTFKAKADIAFSKTVESSEVVQKVLDIARSIENQRDTPNISGVYLYRGRSVHRKNGHPITPETPLESFIQIRFVTTGAAHSVSLDRTLIGAVQRDLSSANSKILFAARRAKIGRVSVTAYFDGETMPIADQNVSFS